MEQVPKSHMKALFCVNSLLFCFENEGHKYVVPRRIGQSVTCLVTDANLTADPGPVPYFRGD